MPFVGSDGISETAAEWPGRSNRSGRQYDTRYFVCGLPEPADEAGKADATNRGGQRDVSVVYTDDFASASRCLKTVATERSPRGAVVFDVIMAPRDARAAVMVLGGSWTVLVLRVYDMTTLPNSVTGVLFQDVGRAPRHKSRMQRCVNKVYHGSVEQMRERVSALSMYQGGESPFMPQFVSLGAESALRGGAELLFVDETLDWTQTIPDLAQLRNLVLRTRRTAELAALRPDACCASGTPPSSQARCHEIGSQPRQAGRTALLTRSGLLPSGCKADGAACGGSAERGEEEEEEAEAGPATRTPIGPGKGLGVRSALREGEDAATGVADRADDRPLTFWCEACERAVPAVAVQEHFVSVLHFSSLARIAARAADLLATANGTLPV